MTQGDPVSLTILNIIVDAVIRAALQEDCGPQEDQHGLVWAVGEHNLCFYADGGQIVERDPMWVQTALTNTVRTFYKVCL